MTRHTSTGGRPALGLAAIPLLVLRTALAVAGFVFALGALFIGLMLSAAIIGWALLRGRRPVAQLFGGRPFGMRGGFGASPQPVRRADRGEVVDVTVREVPDERTH